MLSDETMTIKPFEVLEVLRSYGFLKRYNLVMYCRKNGQVFPFGHESHVCAELSGSLHCGEQCRRVFEKAVNYSLSKKRPVVFRCGTGLLSFAVPFSPDDSMCFCLAGGGVREQSVNLALMEEVARTRNIDAISLLEKLEELPVASVADVKEAAAKAYRILSSLHNESLHSRLLDKTMDRLKAAAEISVQIDRSESAEEAVQLLIEALGILFDLPGIAIALKTEDGTGFSVRATLGLPEEPVVISRYNVMELFRNTDRENPILTGRDVRNVFPWEDSESALCMPVKSGDDLLGFIAVCNRELHQRDIRLMELMAGRLSSKLMLLRKEDRGKECCPMPDPDIPVYPETGSFSGNKQRSSDAKCR